MSRVFRTNIFTDGLSPILGAVLSVRRYLVLRIYPVYRDHHHPLQRSRLAIKCQDSVQHDNVDPLLIHEENSKSRGGSKYIALDLRVLVALPGLHKEASNLPK